MIRTMAVVGTGLIGTSIGLAVSRHGRTVYLMDRDEAAARTASALGAGVYGPPPEPVDLAVIAVPPSRVGAVLAEQQEQRLAHSYTDVASVKSAPERAVLSGSADPRCYVGGHPLAGRERSGPLAARATLFEERSWVLTPSSNTSRTTLNRALEAISLCGGVPLIMESQAHDTAVALVSHVPHLVASLMAARLKGGSMETSRLAGQGLRDVTRIAAGDTRLWSDILQSNATAVARILEDLQEDLAALLTALNEVSSSRPDQGRQSMESVTNLLERGAAGLVDIQPPQRSNVRLRVTVGTRPGDLTRLLAALQEFGVTGEELTPLTAPHSDQLSVEFSVPSALAEEVLGKLGPLGWKSETVDDAPVLLRNAGPAVLRA